MTEEKKEPSAKASENDKKHRKPGWWNKKIPYAARIKEWWVSHDKGTRATAMPEGEDEIICEIWAKDGGGMVTHALGKKTKKRSAEGTAKSRAISQLQEKIPGRLANLEDYEVKWRKP